MTDEGSVFAACTFACSVCTPLLLLLCKHSVTSYFLLPFPRLPHAGKLLGVRGAALSSKSSVALPRLVS